ncbi:pyridoxamine 5'-phosphate oxidase family protein [Lactobacillus sp. PV037]|uniref:pyridoxamine 5'-phosphate oxidase family protein n=1 Tax=unclassified Lactobacillus TaxID=2620435 RepID=UPI00223FA6CF|nr:MULTISPECIES: pyridoxamine 5'-phosphate oxidase family protein [unclassified Lactobacillus]QNQ82105.1 pyridoxamine 5'-phosphate oxidase family protein [Lactobacillus sp. PV012]QNQ83860.1 pyridoxamine 5'-phosphate oxidase family protein [Lactobacillus sp. PV037]
MKKLDSNKLTPEQQGLINDNLAYMATVNEDGTPQVGPKGSMIAINDHQLQYLEKTKSTAYENIKRGSKVAVVAADVPSHSAVRVDGTATIHEDDEFAKEILANSDTPNAYVVVIDIDEVDA